MTQTTITRECTDYRCTDGITMHTGCNGYGKLTAGGKRYKLRSQGRNIGETAATCEGCSGTGMTICGCIPFEQLTEDALDSLLATV